MSDQLKLMKPPGQRRGVKLTAIMCCVCMVGALGSVVLQAGSAQAATTPWTVTPSPNPSGFNTVELQAVTCLSDTNCTAVGYSAEGNSWQTLVESWDGTSWSIVSSPSPGEDPDLYGVSCSSSANCMAVGIYFSGDSALPLVESWDGSSWAVVPSPSPAGSVLQSVSCPSSSSCVAVGSYRNDNDTPLTLVESWDGTSWSVVPSPNSSGSVDNDLDSVSCVSAVDCTAVGGPGTATLVESWDGTSWSIEPSSDQNQGQDGQFYSVSCFSTSGCMAVGAYTNQGLTTLAESWDGTSWSVVPSPSPGNESELKSVSCNDATDCTAVGDSVNPTGGSATLVETWDGTSWSVVPSPNPNPNGNGNALLGVSCPVTAYCTAVGFTANPTMQTLVETTGPGEASGPLSITSSDSATFVPGVPDSFAVSTASPAGEPLPSITETGTLPSDLTFTDYGDGTAFITGTPVPSDAGSYPITITASNGVSPDATQNFTLTILPIGITTTFFNSGTTGEPYSANLAVTGGTAPYTWSISNGTLPSGLSLNASTGAITGTPTTISSSSVSFTVSDSSSPQLSATIELTITVAGVPTVTITPSADPAVSGPVIYSMTVAGTGPTPTGTITVSDGQSGTCSVSLVNGAAGCAITESAAGSPFAVTASYSGDDYYEAGSGTISETVNPAIANVVLTPSSNPANQGSVTYTVLVTGNGPTPTGSVAITDGQGGICSLTLSQGLANCAIDESGLSSPFTITATYGGDENYGTGSASLTDSIGTSTSPGGTATATIGQTTVTGSGEGNVSVLVYPADPVGPPSFTSSGIYFDVAASQGNTFTTQVIQDCDVNGGNQLLWWNPSADGGLGAWEPVVGDPGPIYSAGPPACLTATLDANSSPTISQLTGTVIAVGTTSLAPSFTSINDVEVKAGGKLHFPIATSGFPAPEIRETGKLPTGITFHNNGNGTALISGTAPSKETIYLVTLTASNSNGTATQTLFIVVGKAPAFLSATAVHFTKGNAGSFVVRTSGSPTPLLTESGTLPRNVTFTDNGNGTATLSGTPTTSGVYDLEITASNEIGSITQGLVVTVGHTKKTR